MFYVNNKQVLGIFLNGRNLNYLSYGFGKIIPENRNAEQLNLNLAGRNLSQYRVEYGNIRSGYDNFPIARLDYPINGIFHSPLTYYYGGNIILTKKVPVYINNGYCAIRGPVYNDIDISGNIVHFAINSNFQGHSVNIHPENSPYFNGTVMNNCRNCNITTRYTVPGFDYMNYSNFNIYLPSNANVEKSTDYSLLSNSRNCNYNLNVLGSNLSSTAFFRNLNNCNLNLLVNNAVKFSDGFGGYFNNCNIVFDNINCDLSTRNGWHNLYNCNITGNVKSTSSAQGFLERCNNLNVNLNFAKSSRVLAMLRCNNIKGNIVAGNMTYVNYCSYMNLNVNNGNITFNNITYSDFNVYNAITQFRNVNRTNARSKSKAYVTAIDNCHNLFLYGLNIAGEALLENVYDSNLAFNSGVTRKFMTKRVNNCNIMGFPTTAAYTNNCRFDVGLEEAMSINSSYITWANVWPHGFKTSSASGYLAGLESVNNIIFKCSLAGDDMIFGGSKTFNNNNNMLTNINTFYDGTVTANLPNYHMNIKLNVDCHNLNLGVFMSGPPHGFEYSSISADNIYCTTYKNYFVYMNYGTRIYCENFCNVPFSPERRKFSDNYQPVLLINNYQHSNSQARNFYGGIYRIGRLNCGSMSVYFELHNGACMFINNTVLSSATVNNALLFLGTNARVQGVVNVTNGGLIVNKANYTMGAIGKFVNRNNFAWNFTDSGPWGPQSLLDFCTNV